MKVGRDKSYI